MTKRLQEILARLTRGAAPATGTKPEAAGLERLDKIVAFEAKRPPRPTLALTR